MFRTLYSRLAVTLFALLCVVGVIVVQVIAKSTTLYEQEVAQKLNRELAVYVAEEHPLFQGEVIDQPALEQLFHQMMVINPSIEVYLLDEQGKILRYNAPEGVVVRSKVDLEPIQQYIQGDVRFPIKGEDPRDLDSEKVFSASRIVINDDFRGYLYIVLGGQQYDHIVEMLGDSFILDTAVTVLFAALFVALSGGLLAFFLLTRRLRTLCNLMRQYAEQEHSVPLANRYPGRSDDEIDMIGQQFNVMADRITEQVQDLKRMDNMRREMVANISHDLRTPLTMMRGYLETLELQRESLNAEQQRDYLQTALAHSQRLTEMVEELFELARLDSCETVVYSEPFSMCELVQDVCQKFDLRAKKQNITLESQLNPDTPLVYGDISLMQRVLENLLENGLRHTPDGGHINVDVNIESGNVVVQVADTGCGIPEEDVTRIFERFYQLDKNRSTKDNAGLGLAIVKRILELHGSVIQVTSELNKGTTFSFRLPA